MRSQGKLKISKLSKILLKQMNKNNMHCIGGWGWDFSKNGAVIQKMEKYFLSSKMALNS